MTTTTINRQQAYAAAVCASLRHQAATPPAGIVLATYGTAARGQAQHRCPAAGCDVATGSAAPAGYDAAIYVRPAAWSSAESVILAIWHGLAHVSADPHSTHRDPAFRDAAAGWGLRHPWSKATPRPARDDVAELLAAGLPDFPGAPPGATAPRQVAGRCSLRRFACLCSPPNIIRASRDDSQAVCPACGQEYRGPSSTGFAP